MTKQHFIELADTIRRFNADKSNKGRPFTEKQIDALGRFCVAQNHRFKWEVWLGYLAGKCGPSGGKVKPE